MYDNTQKKSETGYNNMCVSNPECMKGSAIQLEKPMNTDHLKHESIDSFYEIIDDLI